MDRNIWLNRSRRNTIMPERKRISVSKSVNKTLSKNSGCRSGNKENESRGPKRNILGCHILNPKNDRQHTKELSSRRSITRRLSFHKQEECADESPFHAGLQQNVSISSLTFSENCQDVDESMLYPLNSMSVMSSAPSPFRLDLLQKGEQKKGFPSVEKHFNSSKYDSIMGGSDEKLGLSEQTKKYLREMGIDTSPEFGILKQESSKWVPEKKKDEGIKVFCHVDKDTQTATQPSKSEVSGKLSGEMDILSIKHVAKATQTTPLKAGEVGCKSCGKSNPPFSMVMTLKNIFARQYKEREELNNRQTKEIEELMSHFKEFDEGEFCKLNENLRSGAEPQTSVPHPGSLMSIAVNEKAVQNVGIGASSVSQAPAESVLDVSPWMRTQINEQRIPEIAVEEEPPRKLSGILPPQNYIASLEDASCQAVNIESGLFINKIKSSDVGNESGQWGNALCSQNWRKQEVSLIETPRAGRWLVTEDLEEDTLMSNTPTVGLNSMLQGMSIQGQQASMETPATRRLVAKRILKEMESLFY